MLSEEILICPKCHQKLKKSGKSFFCENNHCYDIAKNNYVNLLLCNKKKSKFPGDDKTMIAARNNFLKKGYFENLRRTIEDIVDNEKPTYILDAGCGTGYYSHNLEQKYNIVAIDISKEAIHFTAKNNKNLLSIISSMYELPIKDNSIDLILNIFAPKPKEEFKRVLKNNGVIVEVVPGKDHLKELKKIMFGNEAVFNKEKFAFSDFKIKSSQKLIYLVNIAENEDVINLIRMTPYYYTGGRKKEDLLNQVKSINVTFDFIINVLEKIWYYQNLHIL